MTNKTRRALRHRREKLREQEAGGYGSLLRENVESLQILRRNGLSYREIGKVVPFSLSTIHRYTHMIKPEVFYEPGLSYDQKLRRIFGPGGTYPASPTSDNASEPPGPDPETSSPSESAQAPQSFVVRTDNLFSGTLVVSPKQPTELRLSLQTSHVGSVLEIRASGSPFTVKILTQQQKERNYNWGYREATWRSPWVSSITQELNMHRAGMWYIVFTVDPNSTGQQSIKVEANLRITVPSSPSPAN